ncbi:hypothetical protein SprV_0200663000 [Sparganum proliferum]
MGRSGTPTPPRCQLRRQRHQTDLDLPLGPPLSFHSDCGSNFDSRLFLEVCHTLDVNKTRTTPYHPEGNVLVERTNHTLHNLLLAFCKYNHENDWTTQLPFCLLAYWSTAHSFTGFKPHYLWTGRQLHLPVDLQHPLDLPDPTTVNTYASQLRETIRSADNTARETIGTSSSHQKVQCDRRRLGPHIKSGHFVVIDTLFPTIYLLWDSSQPRAPAFTTNFSKIKPYRGRLPLCTSDSLPILPNDQIPPAAVEVTVPSITEASIPSPVDHSGTEDSAAT